MAYSDRFYEGSPNRNRAPIQTLDGYICSFIHGSFSSFLSQSERRSNEEIKRRSKKEYKELQAEIEEDLPDFEKSYAKVQNFYESLPWN